MAEVRAGVDALDEQIVRLLGRRMRYMDAAARIKQHKHEVRDELRKAEVLANAARTAGQVAFPPDLARHIYDILVEGSIAYEHEQFDRR
jgi:isochorismate pyruvate lyase